MTPDTVGEAVVCLGVFAVFLFALAISGILADYVLPHVPFIRRYIESLPEYEDDSEIAVRYEAEYQKRVAALKNCIWGAIRKIF